MVAVVVADAAVALVADVEVRVVVRQLPQAVLRSLWHQVSIQ